MSPCSEFDVVSPETFPVDRADDPGASCAASIGAPVKIPVFDEVMALVLDEGQNSSNAWRLHELMKAQN